MNVGIYQTVAAFIACVGFAMIHKNKPSRIFTCGLCAALTWVVCLIAGYVTDDNIFMTYFVAAAFGTLLSEIVARITKAPSTIYLIPAILPMVPGGSLYYATYGIVTGNSASASYYGERTALSGFGIAVGLVVVMIFTIYYNRHIHGRRVAK